MSTGKANTQRRVPMASYARWWLVVGTFLSTTVMTTIPTAFMPFPQVEAWVHPLTPLTNSRTTIFDRRRTTESRHRIATRPRPTCRGAAASSYVELTEPETHCQVILLGCFHGSLSSADDVRQLVTPNTTVVVLELCASRFADLRRSYYQEHPEWDHGAETAEMALGEPNNNEEVNTMAWTPPTMGQIRPPPPTGRPSRPPPPSQPWLFRFMQMVQRRTQTQGVAAGAAAALLGSVSGLQTALSGLQPGLEFTTALELALIQRKDIVLADRSVDEILLDLGHLPQLSFSMWRSLMDGTPSPSSSWSSSSSSFTTKALTTTTRASNAEPQEAWSRWSQSFGREHAALTTALFGSPAQGPPVNQLSLLAFLTRSPAAIRDLIRLTVPPLVFLQCVAILLEQGTFWLMNTATWASTSTAGSWSSWADQVLLSSAPPAVDPNDPVMNWWVIAAMNSVLIALGYMSVALPAARVILRERDDELAKGIRLACQLAQRSVPNHHNTAAENSEDEPSRPATGRVVAVLGLLHVNGVAQRLMSSKREGPAP